MYAYHIQNFPSHVLLRRVGGQGLPCGSYHFGVYDPQDAVKPNKGKGLICPALS